MNKDGYYLEKYFIFGIVAAIIIYFVNFFSGILVSLFLVIVFIMYKLDRKELKKIESTNVILPSKPIVVNEQLFPFPFCIVRNRMIVSRNLMFERIFQSNLKSQEPFIDELIPGITLSEKRINATIFNKNYVLFISPYNESTTAENATNDKNENTYIIYYLEAETAITESTIVSLIFIDNYDDVLETMEDIQRPILLALLDRKLANLAQQVSGIVRKFEKDKYIFIFGGDKLDYLKEKKFDILDQVRSFEMGNKIPITLSMGIGINGNTLSQSMEFSRAAIDLALGRGGDQVVLKDDDKYYYFGGKIREFGSTSKVRARVKAYALAELIVEASEVLIMGHRNPDLDCLGSAIGVYKIVMSKGKRCNIILNKPSGSIKLLYERLTQLKEYREDVFVTEEQILGSITDKTLLIVVDCHRPSIMESRKVFEKTKKVVVFDHHRKASEPIKDLVLEYHEPFASSTSELITEMIKHTNNVKLEKVEADALLSGITLDTKNFAFKTGAKTFEAAAFLRRAGADTVRVKVLFQYTMESYKAKVMAVNRAEIIDENIAVAICPPETENPSLACAQAADDLLGIYGVQSSYVLCGDSNEIYISARSLGEVNVQVVMEMLGGGGHQTIAGAQMFGITIEEAKEKLLISINKYLEDNK